MEKKQGAFRTTIGGQALIEGILMRGPEKDAIVVRSPEGLVTKVTERKFIRSKYPILGVPILRGAVTFISSMITGVKALMFSADYFPDEEDAQPGKFDQWLEKHIPAEKLQSLVVAFSVILSLALTLVLFMLLPTFIAGLFHAKSAAVHNIIEGVVKVAIFLGYLILCSKQKDVHRVFCYHGAEHKTIFCYEAGLPLTVEESADGWVYFLLYNNDGRPVIYRWDTAALEFAVSDTEVYTGPYYSNQEPDYHGLVWCEYYARTIGDTYGVEVLLWEDANLVQPWDYNFETEYLVPVFKRELDWLNERLANFPEGMLEAAISHFSSLKICLVREIIGSAESGSVSRANGIQFMNGTDAYIVLAAGDTSEKALYHELYHVMETHILGNSIALDQWAKLNPVGFEYDYDYLANAQRDGSEFLQPDTRSFVDTYSMSYPKEDRARIFEYAMTAGNEPLFAASPLQYKLKMLCQGIREAFGLKKSPENFLWEQYLNQPMAYTGK